MLERQQTSCFTCFLLIVLYICIQMMLIHDFDWLRKAACLSHLDSGHIPYYGTARYRIWILKQCCKCRRDRPQGLYKKLKLNVSMYRYFFLPFFSPILWHPNAILSHLCNSPMGSGEAKVESCSLWNMTRQTKLLNTCPLNLKASRTNV
jgi:hypothetical protein